MVPKYFTQCLVGVAVAVALLLALGVELGTLAYFVAALACPLMMIFMMRGMAHGHSSHRAADPLDGNADDRAILR